MRTAQNKHISELFEIPTKPVESIPRPPCELQEALATRIQGTQRASIQQKEHIA